MPNILDFFKKKLLNKKFSNLGEGHKLSIDKTVSSNKIRQTYDVNIEKHAEVQSKAGEAALNRMSNKYDSKSKPRSEYLNANLPKNVDIIENLDSKLSHTIFIEKIKQLSRVLFWCPVLFGYDLIGTRNEIQLAIDSYLQSESAFNPMEAATLNLICGIEISPLPPSVDISDPSSLTTQDVRNKRRQNFIKIVRNLLDHPENEMFRRLRVSNKFIADLLQIKGSEGFFKALGFVRETMTAANQTDCADQSLPPEDFLVLPTSTDQQMDHLKVMLDLLETGDPILPELYRDTIVMKVEGRSACLLNSEDLPDEFYSLSRDELRRLQLERREAVESSGMLMTKAMRERMRARDLRIYRFVLIRVRMPDELILQGTFYAVDKLQDVRIWVSECLENPAISFSLRSSPGLQSSSWSNAQPTARITLENNESTLAELGLAPSSLLFLAFTDSSLATSIRADLPRLNLSTC